ncbi:hypothetical protein O7632_08350 [Solwaraspora sp. WMMD406]|uniref:hypothetical protein n=1 Tax=Solwaraspora sp. WMMD406 TaxID=3016095 RepID=UPI0024177C11|nr:hypothetical protein [Solwaraspora sp. WMMD406]MDG4764115.1 hypothetical protein [Solwaraspora sp. WMMD406]
MTPIRAIPALVYATIAGPVIVGLAAAAGAAAGVVDDAFVWPVRLAVFVVLVVGMGLTANRFIVWLRSPGSPR